MNKLYARKIGRRESIRWLAAMSATTVLPLGFSLNTQAEDLVQEAAADWPQLDLAPIEAQGYGTDPVLISPQPAPWPRTLTSPQLILVATLCDILIPAENNIPAASAVGVPDVLDEWISAPYPQQRRHRALIMPGLQWIDTESKRRFGKSFVAIGHQQRIEIIENIAFSSDQMPEKFKQPGAFFALLRQLVVGIYYSSPQGIKDIGYIGNTPMKGDYPGPTPEAMAQLNELLDQLGLDRPTT